MTQVRPGIQRGRADFGWLDSRHTFSFGNYYDPAHMGFRTLRVINDDRVRGGGGFGTHPHRDMEIISYVVTGGLEHKDSMGTGSVIRPGEVQIMSAGTGVTHSEFNTSADEAVRFLQIWILPDRTGLAPSYQQRHFGEQRRNTLRLVVSPDGADGSLRVHQDAAMYASVLDAGHTVVHEAAVGRHTWVQVVRGEVTIGGDAFVEGDGYATGDAGPITVSATSDAEFLLFDLA